MTEKGDVQKEKVSAKKYYLYFSLFFLIQFIITFVILFTDHNLQTDFGTVPKYFIHWYGLMITGIADIIAFIVLLIINKRQFVLVGIIWAAFMAVFQVADIATYASLGVGLTAGKFATYLFGFSKFPGSLPYIPGLYDVLFAIYIIAAGFGFYVYRKLPGESPEKKDVSEETKAK